MTGKAPLPCGCVITYGDDGYEEVTRRCRKHQREWDDAIRRAEQNRKLQ